MSAAEDHKVEAKIEMKPKVCDFL